MVDAVPQEELRALVVEFSLQDATYPCGKGRGGKVFRPYPACPACETNGLNVQLLMLDDGHRLSCGSRWDLPCSCRRATGPHGVPVAICTACAHVTVLADVDIGPISVPKGDR